MISNGHYTQQQVATLLDLGTTGAVATIERYAIKKIASQVRKLGIASDIIEAVRSGECTSIDFEDCMILALAEDLGLPAPTHRFESFEDTIRELFEEAKAHGNI